MSECRYIDHEYLCEKEELDAEIARLLAKVEQLERESLVWKREIERADDRVEKAEAVVRAAETWSQSCHVSRNPEKHQINADNCEGCKAEIALCDVLAAFRGRP